MGATTALYLVGVNHPNRFIRVLAMGLIFHIIILRSLGMFKRELFVLLLGALTASYACGVSLLVPLGLLFAGTQAWCWIQAAQRVEYVAGHRAGAKGYTGQFCENTTEAMQALVERDNGPDGPVDALHYIEVDIQESADGQIVILHDFHLSDAFPEVGPNVEPYKKLQEQGCKQPLSMLMVKDVTSVQLRSLCLAGRSGLHAPTLQEFMSAFRASGCRRPLVIEIKQLLSDAGREQLISLMREHKPYAEQQEYLYPQHRHPRLGFLALISFPHYYAASFGELGSEQWRYWGSKLAALDIPVRCCFLEMLSYCHGLSKA